MLRWHEDRPLLLGLFLDHILFELLEPLIFFLLEVLLLGEEILKSFVFLSTRKPASTA